jgi:hypothetical protein
MFWERLSSAALIIAVAAGQAGQQGVGPPEEVRQLLAALEKLDHEVTDVAQRTAGAGIAQDAQSIRGPLRWLGERAATWKPSKPGAGQALLKSIMRYSEALEALPSDPGSAQEVLRAVEEDATLKYEFCRAVGLAATIKAEVRTLRKQQEVPGWEVYYLPRFLTLLKTAKPDRFPRVSSPTAEDLAPGNYVVWAVDPQTKTKAEPVTARVGADRSGRVVIDLPLP